VARSCFDKVDEIIYQIRSMILDLTWCLEQIRDKSPNLLDILAFYQINQVTIKIGNKAKTPDSISLWRYQTKEQWLQRLLFFDFRKYGEEIFCRLEAENIKRDTITCV
jgi:hypothetical protein